MHHSRNFSATPFALNGALPAAEATQFEDRSPRSYGPRILLAERACAERHPPVLHQADILGKLGEVTLLDAPGRHDSSAVQTDPQINRLRVRAQNNSVDGRSLANLRWAYRYARQFRRRMKDAPDAVIAYEPDAAALLLLPRIGQRSTMRIVHLHETPDKDLYSDSGTSKVAIRYMLAKLDDADLVVLPDESRAAYAVEVAQLRCAPSVVMNCPPLLAQLPGSKLLPWLADRGVTTREIVHFQGAIGTERGLDTIIRSMRYWPAQSIFVVVGDGSASVKSSLLSLAEELGVSARVFFVGPVPYSDVLSYAVGAAVGVTMVRPIDRNTLWTAGGSNKRFEYAALGIPQVTNLGPGLEKLFGIPRIATLVRESDTQQVGKAIAEYLHNSSFASEIGARARVLHLRCYNYEAQFLPVVNRIREWTESRVRRVW